MLRSWLFVAAVLLAGCAGGGNAPPPEDPPPPPTPVPIDTALAQAVVAVRAGTPADVAFAANFPAATTAAAEAQVPFLDPDAGPQLRPKGPPAVDPVGLGFTATMGIASPRSPWKSDFVSNIEVRPPHLAWYLGWSNFLEIGVPLDPAWQARGIDEAFESGIVIPSSWGCAEVRAQLRSAYVPSGEAAQTTDWSNVYLIGTCPVPMPARVPLATPEPAESAALAAGTCLLALLYRDRRF